MTCYLRGGSKEASSPAPRAVESGELHHGEEAVVVECEELDVRGEEDISRQFLAPHTGEVVALHHQRGEALGPHTQGEVPQVVD